MIKLSVVLAVKNEEENIGACLTSVKGIADEIIVYDEHSDDRTREIAREYGAKVYMYRHEDNFHETKQKAIERAKGKWILQLDADERVTRELRREIADVVEMGDDLIREKVARDSKSKKHELFKRHQRAVEKRDGRIGKKGEIVAFFLPRVNMFLGKPLVYAGVYPDGVIRLIRNKKAYLPAKSVHEQMVVKGEVAWLMGDLEHHDSPTLARYFDRANRYTDYTASEFSRKKVSKGVFTLLYYSFIKPVVVFLNLFFRHKGVLDGMRGFLWSALSGLHYPIAYYKYVTY